MGRRLLALLMLATFALAACAPYSGPTATCFTLLVAEAECDFRPLAGDEGLDGGA